MQPMVHEHTTTPDSQGRQICTRCGEAVVTPILDFDDPRLQEPVFTEPTTQEWIDALNASVHANGGQELDLLLIELFTRLDVEWPPYIMLLVEKYGGQDPPHFGDRRLA